MLNSDGKC